MGVEFILYTDHQPLIYLHNMKIIDSRLARTLEELADYNFQIQYLPGKGNSAADALSRLSVHDYDHEKEAKVDSNTIPLGLSLLEAVPGGGDSMTDSLFLLLKLLPIDDKINSSSKLRGRLVDYMLQNPASVGIVLDRLVRKKLRLMRHPGQILGMEALYAFSLIFGCQIFVHYGGPTPVQWCGAALKMSRTTPRLHLQCIAGIQFNPLVENEDYKHEESLETASRPQVSAVVQSDNEDEMVREVDFSSQCIALGWCRNHAITHETSLMISIHGSLHCALVDSGAQVLVPTWPVPFTCLLIAARLSKLGAWEHRLVQSWVLYL